MFFVIQSDSRCRLNKYILNFLKGKEREKNMEREICTHGGLRDEFDHPYLSFLYAVLKEN